MADEDCHALTGCGDVGRIGAQSRVRQAFTELLEKHVATLLREQVPDADDDGDGPLEQSQRRESRDRCEVGECALRRQLHRSEGRHRQGRAMRLNGGFRGSGLSI